MYVYFFLKMVDGSCHLFEPTLTQWEIFIVCGAVWRDVSSHVRPTRDLTDQTNMATKLESEYLVLITIIDHHQIQPLSLTDSRKSAPHPAAIIGIY